MLFKLNLNIFHGKCNAIYFIDLMIKKKKWEEKLHYQKDMLPSKGQVHEKHKTRIE